jgi:cytochrome c
VLWLSNQLLIESSERGAAARAMLGGDPKRPPTLMTRYGCVGCHTISGVPGADGQVGAPLLQMRERVFIAGALPNTASNLIDWIVHPEAHGPHSAMPSRPRSANGGQEVPECMWLWLRDRPAAAQLYW